MHDKQVRRRRAVLAVLVVASLILLTAYFGKAPSSPLHQAQREIVEVLSPVQEGASKVLSPVRDVAGWFSSTLRAKSQVHRLQATVQQLRFKVALEQQDQIVNQQLSSEIKLDQNLGLNSSTLVAANIYEHDSQLWNQSITVDKGSDDGVARNDPVIGDKGLVGVVTTVDPTVSVVTLITDPSFQVAAEVQAGGGYDGQLVPETGNPSQMQLQYLPPSAQGITTGQLVVTSGFKDGKTGLDSLYPAAIPIGTVSNANQNSLINDQQILVTPLVNVRQLRTVQILTKPRDGTESAQVPTQSAQVPSTAGTTTGTTGG